MNKLILLMSNLNFEIIQNLKTQKIKFSFYNHFQLDFEVGT